MNLKLSDRTVFWLVLTLKVFKGKLKRFAKNRVALRSTDIPTIF